MLQPYGNSQAVNNSEQKKMDVEEIKKEEECSEEIREELHEHEEKKPELENEKSEELNEIVPEGKDSLSGLPHVDPVVIPANEIMDKKQKYVSQFELVTHGRGLLLCETYYEQKCTWIANKGCFKMYVPVRQVHPRSSEWYVYPAARMFAGSYALCMNLELNPKLRSVFSPKDIKWEENYLHIKYRKQRQKGVVLPAGMLLGYLYINEPWMERPTNYITTIPTYSIKYAR